MDDLKNKKIIVAGGSGLIGAAIVEVEHFGWPGAPERLDQEHEHLDFTLVVAGLDPNDVARGIIKDGVDA